MKLDVFGQQLYDYYQGLIAPDYREIGERDDSYIRVYGPSAMVFHIV